MGLHLGWIPNEPGLRPRDFGQPAPSEPAPDPAKVAALAAAHHARALWTRLLIAIGLFAFLLFGLIAAFTRVHWAWAVAAGLAACCWLPAVLLGLRRRRAAAGLRQETEARSRQHATELAAYTRGKAQWAQAEAERIATAPRWLQVGAHEDSSRLDVFGGTGLGRQNMVTGLGWELLGQRAVIVLDLSQDRVAEGLLAAAARAGLPAADYELPHDLAATPLLAGLDGGEIASLIVEVVHADDASATAAGRATDLMIVKKIAGVLAPDVSIGRLHAALTVLLGDEPASDAPATDDPAGADAPLADNHLLAAGERARLRALFGDGFRHQVAGNLVRLAAVVEPLTALGTDAAERPSARLTCLSLAGGPRDVAADLTAALVVQWVTRAIADGADATRPAVILAGADEQSTRHLARLTAVCERYGIPLVRAFARLTEESARHLDTRQTAFMRLATRPEALRAAEHIGLERRFVAGRFAHRHAVSRSRSRTTSESFTHLTGRTEGESVTHTTGTTKGQAQSESHVPRPEQQQLNVNVDSRGGSGGGRADGPGPSGREPGGRGGGSGDRRGSEGAGGRQDGGARPRSGSAGSGGGSGGGSRVSVSSGGRGGRRGMDVIKTKTSFTMEHESEANTKSWSTTEENSHTTTTAQTRTDGVSVGDEISYELVYDHRVQPETLMALPEDQMLAPHITEAPPAPVPGAGPAPAEAAAAAGAGLAGPGTDRVARGRTEGKLVALVIDPAVIDGEPVAAVRPGEIPAFEPPAPPVSAQVPDYQRARRPALDAG